jgi:hypothetical protein
MNLEKSRKRITRFLIGTTILVVGVGAAAAATSSHSTPTVASAPTTTATAPTTAPAAGGATTAPTTPAPSSTPTTTAPAAPVAPVSSPAPVSTPAPTSPSVTTPTLPSSAPAPAPAAPKTITVPSFIGQNLTQATGDQLPWIVRAGTCTVGGQSTAGGDTDIVTSQSQAPGAVVTEDLSVPWYVITVNYTAAIPAGEPAGYNPCTGAGA